MSGGTFDYNQYILSDIADDIERLIAGNNTKNDFGYSRDFSNETLEKFKEAVIQIKIASNMIHRVDWLVASDDSEETFHERWDKEVFNVT